MKSSLRQDVKNFLFGNGPEAKLKLAEAVAHLKNQVAPDLIAGGMTQDQITDAAGTVVKLLIEGGPEGGKLIAGKVLALHAAGML